MVQDKKDGLGTISENPDLCIVWCNVLGSVTDANLAFCNLLQYNQAELIGKNLDDFVYQGDASLGQLEYRQLQAGLITNFVVEKRYSTKSQNIVWVKASFAAVKNSVGKTDVIMAVFQNITVLKNTEALLRKTEASLRFLLNNSDTAIFLLDTQMRVVTINQMAQDWAFIELGRHVVNGESFIGLLPDKYRNMALAVIKNAIEGQSYNYEDKYISSTGKTGWYHVKFDCIKDENGVITGSCISTRETTPYRTAQAEVKAMNDLLEQKVKERTAELEVANKELEAFTYSVSHDLMAPLRIIDGFSQVLLDDYRNKLDEEGFQTLQVIKRNANRMGELVNDLLNLARLGRANLIKRSASMQDIVATVIDEMRFTTNKLEAKIKVKDLAPADCDGVLIKQVWSNLVSNAIKYSRTKAEPLVEIGSIEQNGLIIYYIRDNGVGFDTQFSGKLFGVFQRLHKPNEFEGTGVGLAIVHRIITRHGGRVWADAKLNEGAVFYFTLP